MKRFETTINDFKVSVNPHEVHNPYCDIVNHTTYIDGVKTVCSFHRYINENKKGFEIYKYKDGEIGYYWSRLYSYDNYPSKYEDVFNKLENAHNEIFGK